MCTSRFHGELNTRSPPHGARQANRLCCGAATGFDMQAAQTVGETPLLVPPRRRDIPLENVQGHVELGLVGGGRAHQLALGVRRHDGPVGQGEAVDGAEGLVVPEHWGRTLEHRSRPGSTPMEMVDFESVSLADVTFLLMPLSERHLSVILEMEPLNAAPHQVLPARLHGRSQEAGVQGRYLT